MTGRLGIGKRAWQIIALLVLLVLLVVAGYIGYHRVTNTRLTAYFATTTGLYNGDPVRVLGVNVGHVTSITPRSGDVKVEMDVDRSVKIPVDARAVVVAQSLVSGRFIQLTPVYSSGPQMTDGTDIPMERTAVPMEWDQVKQQLQRLTDAVGPNGADRVPRRAPSTSARKTSTAQGNPSTARSPSSPT